MYDIVVVGGGPAGVTAALRACELGANVALVERSRLGGTCTNDGCVPTRVLAKAARLMRDAAQFADYGLLADGLPQVDFAALLSRTQQVVYEIHEKKQLLAHLQDVGVTTHSDVGDTHFADAHTLQTASGSVLNGDRFVLCVGGHARRLDFPGAEYALTHSDVWNMQELPRAVAVIGGGATGAQLASVFEAFGAQVTLLDVAPRLLLTEDEDIAAEVASSFAGHGIDVQTGIETVVSIEAQSIGPRYRFTYRKGGKDTTLEVDAVIQSVGWPGNIERLNLEAAGVTVNRSYVQVDDTLRTTAPNIWAAGDITGRMMLVQSAGSQARLAVENALASNGQTATFRLVPHGGFTDPEYGGVGLTEAQARERGHDIAVAKVPFSDLDRAVIDGRATGFCKLMVDRGTREILGAHVVGETAVEIVSTVSAGMASGLKVEQLADLDLAYPTFVAVLGLAARDLARQLQLVRVAPQWLELGQPRAGEWERYEH